MAECPFCGTSVPDLASQCPKCGAAVASNSDCPPLDAATLQNQVLSLLSKGSKIEAIKVFREATGVGLAEAKAAVEALERSQMIAMSGTVDSDVEAEVLPILKQQGLIPAIKVYRERTGTGLKESKDAVEAIAAKHGIVASRTTGCAGAALVLIILITAGWIEVVWPVLACCKLP